MGWRENISPKRAWRGAVAASSFFVVLGTYLAILSIHNIFFPWTKRDFIEFVGTLEESPKFEKGKNHSLKIKLQEAKGFEFTIDGDNYTVMKNSGGIGSLDHGNKVSVLVDKSQYYAKISKSISPTFLQQTINWKWIRVYEFKSDEHTYLDLIEVLEELKRVAKFYLIFGFVCWIGAYFYLRYEYQIYMKSKPFNITNSQ
ncbi:MAG: hypothetical protein K0S23_1065 [Fluviicola sp.]|jgi:hypothetical protein|uniref:hypothetical protein n=1 Tax=Fluviicola sp. TaxID=1917219 RepID=UPI0026185655|nr:hypothetical protein [Fluviicola sp.]MDF3026758.1 hypothetical protein [Fluviicola sp.]